jgi:ferredoxin
MSKFPTVRDLCVDRSRLFEDLKKISGWIPIDGTYDLGPGPRMSQREQQQAYDYSRCMTCGSCLEACPQINERSGFIGPMAIGQARLFNSHPTGKLNADERLEALSGRTASRPAATRKTASRYAPRRSRSRAPSPRCTGRPLSIASRNGWAGKPFGYCPGYPDWRWRHCEFRLSMIRIWPI